MAEQRQKPANENLALGSQMPRRCHCRAAEAFTVAPVAGILVTDQVANMTVMQPHGVEAMTMAKAPILAICALLAVAAPVSAQETASVDAGYRLAQQACAQCHAIERDDLVSPNIDAPAFFDIANTLGMTATALSVWFRTPHPTMPNFVISKGETANLIAYIGSLKKLENRIIQDDK